MGVIEQKHLSAVKTAKQIEEPRYFPASGSLGGSRTIYLKGVEV